jgi:hypothetical protein
MREGSVGAAAEWPGPENKFISTNAERPPINGVSVTTLVENFWGHVGHGSSHASKKTALRIVDGNIKVGKMSMATFIKEDIVRLDISGIDRKRRKRKGSADKYDNGPMHDVLFVEETKSRRKLCHIKPDGVL